MKKTKLKTIANFILLKTKPYFDQVEVLLGTDDSTTIRFANNLIYQPMSFTSYWLKIRLVKNKKIAVVNLSNFSKKAILKALQAGKKLCDLQKPDKNF